ncbi:MAG: hypothetical protein A3I54_03285 [Candidatus Levybacteria bacterium RIFCSPLOWO2_02_FULL_41_11]|nr:MAG: hypothetical protein A3I54_03285 [Candidatus Levybacteria bacterium RIFCSPLOWO2_02_FULL_41_11]
MMYYRVSGVIFGVVALFHLLRIIQGWSVQLGPYVIPIWLSYFGLAIGAYLSYLGCIKYGKWM